MGDKANETYNAVIDYTLTLGLGDCGLEFLRAWREGDFEAIRLEWPEAPKEVYVDRISVMQEYCMSERIKKLEKAVEDAREAFAFYAENHKKKGDVEKEARNRELEEKMREALNGRG